MIFRLGVHAELERVVTVETGGDEGEAVAGQEPGDVRERGAELI
jgi:hypothetical protein